VSGQLKTSVEYLFPHFQNKYKPEVFRKSATIILPLIQKFIIISIEKCCLLTSTAPKNFCTRNREIKIDGVAL